MNGCTVGFEGFDPADEGLPKALASTGNGYLCIPGSVECEHSDGVHGPPTYALGRLEVDVAALAGARLATLKG